MTKLKMICTECGSTDVRRDAWANWCEKIQDWELAEVYDNAFCIDCDGECSIKEEEIEE
jgi:hypothetical protein